VFNIVLLEQPEAEEEIDQFPELLGSLPDFDQNGVLFIEVGWLSQAEVEDQVEGHVCEIADAVHIYI
jgi:hypothetical protein